MPFKPTHFSFYGHQNNSPNSCVPGVRHNVKNYAGSPASLCTFWARFCMFFWTKMHIPTQVFYKNAHFGTLFFAKIMKKILFLGGVCSTFQSYPEMQACKIVPKMYKTMPDSRHNFSHFAGDPEHLNLASCCDIHKMKNVLV